MSDADRPDGGRPDAERPELTDTDHVTNVCTDVDRTQESSEDVLGFVEAPSQR